MKETLKKEIEGKFGSSVSGETSASDGVTGSLLSWKYSDYLRMFTVIGLITNEETMLLRMEDLIQKNMELKKGTFSLASSYVYYEMQARILVKPLLTTNKSRDSNKLSSKETPKRFNPISSSVI